MELMRQMSGLMRNCARLAFAGFFLFFYIAAVAAQTPAGERKIGPSGLPLPRFVSLKADEVYVRRGPGWDHAVAWVYRRAGLPVEIIAEFDAWRQVRDSEGATGWIYSRLLSGRRTALVAPWTKDQTVYPLYSSPSKLSPVAARLSPNVLADILNCSDKWCNVSANNVTGWLPEDNLWGVYPNEEVK